MIKDRITRLIYRTVYITMGIIAVISSLGWFDREYNENWYLYYTELSNYICIAVMIIGFSYTLRKIREGNLKGTDSYMPRIRFYCVIMILVTFFVYNILLSGGRTLFEYFSDYTNVMMHCILPIMFAGDWLLFTEHGRLKIADPLISTVFPLVYVAFIMIRAALLPDHSAVSLLYPYFFLDVGELGVAGTIKWICILVAVFVIFGYLLYFMQKRWRPEDKK